LQLLKAAEDCRKLWAAALARHPEEKDDLTVSLLTCVRPVTQETIMRMRKLTEFVDPNFKPTVVQEKKIGNKTAKAVLKK